MECILPIYEHIDSSMQNKVNVCANWYININKMDK